MADYSEFPALVVTVSDRSAAGEREDKSGPVALDLLRKAGFTDCSGTIVPDDIDEIESIMRQAVAQGTALLITTGGTGFAQRDVTPEATERVIERRADAMAREMHAISRQKTPFAMLSRGVCGIVENTLIVNLPGSPKAVRECIEALMPAIPHGLRILRGTPDDVH